MLELAEASEDLGLKFENSDLKVINLLIIFVIFVIE